MKRIIKRITLIILSTTFSIGLYLYLFQPIKLFKPQSPYVLNLLPLERMLNRDEVESDRNYLIETIEETHPIFLEGLDADYLDAKETFISNTNREMSVKELQNYSALYINSLNDGHTRLFWNDDTFLDITWQYSGDTLFISDRGEVISINSTPIGEIFNVISTLFPEENNWAKVVNYTRYSTSLEVLDRAGIERSDEYNIELLTESGREWITVKTTQENPLYNYVDNSIYSKQVDENTLYIKLGICEINDSYNSVLRDVKNSINQGVTNYIIDIQNNPGGNSNAGKILLETLGMTTGSYGCVIRMSDLAQNRYGYIRNWGHISFKGNNRSIRNKDLELFILMNEYSYSSATMLATWVSDGNLGTIVGRPSSNSPSCYGDILNFQLPHSRIKGIVSYKKWIRPDKTKDRDNILETDIYVDYSNDALETVLGMISEG